MRPASKEIVLTSEMRVQHFQETGQYAEDRDIKRYFNDRALVSDDVADIVNTSKNNHYTIACKLETLPMMKLVLDSMKDELTPYQGFLLGALLKYRLRVNKKEGQLEGDLEKMMVYEQLLEEELNDNS